jgi:hypothetical protein
VLGIGCGRIGSISNPVPIREIKATLEAAVRNFELGRGILAMRRQIKQKILDHAADFISPPQLEL